MHHIRKAFTIIEVLIVMGVILLLLGMLLPAVNRSIEQARIAKCESNQHQVFVALRAFAQDHSECCPGSCGSVPPGGPGSTAYCGIGQLISCTDSLSQSTLEMSSRSVLLIRRYLPDSSVFHCPQQDLDAGLILGVTGCSATFHYVFNQYFVGDRPCAPGGPTPATTYLPVYSGQFPDVTSPITFNRAANVSSQCVLITEDGMPDPMGAAGGGIQDSTQEYLDRTAVTYIHANPWHVVRPHKSTDSLPFIIADAAICTYVDGHTEMVYVKRMDGSTNYTVPSSNGRPLGENVSTVGLPR